MFGTSCATNAPPVPIVTLSLPAATASPSAVWNDGHEISATPAADVPSARYTVPPMVVSAGPSARTAVDKVSAISNPISTEITRPFVVRNRFPFAIESPRISSSLLIALRNPVQSARGPSTIRIRVCLQAYRKSQPYERAFRRRGWEP